MAWPISPAPIIATRLRSPVDTAETLEDSRTRPRNCAAMIPLQHVTPARVAALAAAAAVISAALPALIGFYVATVAVAAMLGAAFAAYLAVVDEPAEWAIFELATCVVAALLTVAGHEPALPRRDGRGDASRSRSSWPGWRSPSPAPPRSRRSCGSTARSSGACAAPACTASPAAPDRAGLEKRARWLYARSVRAGVQTCRRAGAVGIASTVATGSVHGVRRRCGRSWSSSSARTPRSRPTRAGRCGSRGTWGRRPAERHVRFSVWDEAGVAESAISLDEIEADRLARFLLEPAGRRHRPRTVWDRLGTLRRHV